MRVNKRIESVQVRIVASVVLVLTLILPATLAPSAANAATPRQSHGVLDQLVPKPRHDGPMAAKTTAVKPSVRAPQCSSPINGKYVCLHVTTKSPSTVKPNAASAAPGIVTQPADLCHPGQTWARRTEVCSEYSLDFTTVRTVNGVEELTGEILFDTYSYSFTSVDLTDWGYQYQLATPTSGWGDALTTIISGQADTSAGSCTLTGSSFPPQPVTPPLTLRGGESLFTTTATATGAVGYCDARFTVTFTTPGYTTEQWVDNEEPIRCDNAIGANLNRAARPGCVVPWGRGYVVYSQSRYPSLTSHVSRAQASGLPGATVDAPLYLTTDTNTINTNRRLACGDAPSIAGLSCDEYPLATTYEGLSAGGTRRSFPGCNINAPQATGPTGASACMITASENSAQGALQAAMNYDWRVMDADPYIVEIGA